MKIPNQAAAAAITLIASQTAHAQGCVGDVAVDGRVDGGDLGVLLANWGPVTSTALSRACDIDNSGQVDGADLGALLAGWGACPSSPWATVLEAQPDPAVVTDPALRAGIAATGLPWRVRDNGTGIEMLLVPPGSFQMGCVMGSDLYACRFVELPVHQVTLTRAIYIGRYEVTQAQWLAQMGSNPSFWQGADRPVDSVSWNAIQPFLADTGLRLPSEAEWEFACRAGTQTPYYNGSTNDGSVGDIAWYQLNTCQGSWCYGPGNVGLKAANALGFHDMIGNAWEWVSDRFDIYPASPQTDPTGPAFGLDRVVRGGGAESIEQACSFSRLGSAPTSGQGYTSFGFRVARDP
jgi:formylglycine-generating enzyme required for sulfatase activity